MITLITGVPGSGKTLYSLCYVKQLAERDGRTVYQNGVSELVLPWELLDNPERWHKDVPSMGVVFMDECQRVFRPRGQGSNVPDFVSALETHRHRGLDIFLITQHPMLIDSNVRRLVGQHFHVVRRFGTSFATVHEWASCKEISKAAIAESTKHEFRYPREAFSWYKSAEVHTHKRRLPARVWFLLASPFLLGGLVWFGVSKFKDLGGAVSTPIGAAAAAVKGSGVPDHGKAPVGALSTGQYLNLQVPRVASLAFTAPVYDTVTSVQRAPVPVACAASAARCQCYSQDATKMQVDDLVCRQIVADGFFVPFEVRNAGGGAVKAEGNGGAVHGGGAAPVGAPRPPLQSSAAPSGGESARGGVIAAVAPVLPQASPKTAP